METELLLCTSSKEYDSDRLRYIRRGTKVTDMRSTLLAERILEIHIQDVVIEGLPQGEQITWRGLRKTAGYTEAKRCGHPISSSCFPFNFL